MPVSDAPVILNSSVSRPIASRESLIKSSVSINPHSSVGGFNSPPHVGGKRMNDSIAAAAQQNNAAMEAATQNQVLFNTVYFPANN
jgi:hypothetical protein